MPEIGGFLGWKQPPPAATITTLVLNCFPASVRPMNSGLSAVPTDCRVFNHFVEMEGRIKRLDLLQEMSS